ncbi:patatin-like phospholipase family protein [Shewanella submarina]|uniref:Patatin-like phospholipase family protein n=1 Tax=Shewanella submarina TaxID=2016376 RepID=A0ABV7G5J7_9GAMM|nr:patatin-like phospholipase family protein [Shewanella submarina]MCL1038296.1 patatin-like phospholipase family protein [Shewanella submarina]
MKRATWSLVLLWAISLCLPVYATEDDRPKIGLVLSGGGAKGAAHIGVLKVLEAYHIPVDYVAGTSIGAFVGGMYALGYSSTEIETIMMGTDWAKGYSDTIPRQDLSYRDKQFRDQYNIPINVGYSDDQVKVPSGLLQGQTMSMLLRNATNLVPEYTNFDDMAIPYRAVATDLVTSKAFVLSKGSVVVAMQASATVPGALQPAEVDGTLLVDGGIANNMPVDVVKAMGADIVIAVDIGSALVGKDQLNSTVAVLNQLSTMLTNASTERQVGLLSDRDILIRPDVGEMSTTDFAIMPKVLPLGITAALEFHNQLEALTVSDEAYQAYENHKSRLRAQWQSELKLPLARVVLENHSKVSDTLILDTLGLKQGLVVNRADLDAAIERVYALNQFERVNAEFRDTPTGRELLMITRAKSWGPDYFQLGLNWEDDFTLDSTITLDMAYTLTDVTENGGEWHNELRLGSEKLVSSQFYQPLDSDQLFYVQGTGKYEINDWDIYDGNNRVAELDKSSFQLFAGIGYNYTNAGRVELGLIGEWGEISNKSLLTDDFSYESWGGYFKLGYDTLDSISFPTSGNRLNLNLYWRNDDYPPFIDQDSGEGSLQIEADWKGAVSVGSHGLVGKAAFATVNKDGLFSVHLSELGGFLNLSGFHRNALVGSHKLFGAIMYQYDLGRDALGMTEFPLYLGASLEAGNIWELSDQIAVNDLIYASSLYLGTDTDLGPAALGIGLTDTGDKAFYLFLGKNF